MKPKPDTDYREPESLSEEFFGTDPKAADLQKRVFRYFAVLLALNLAIYLAR